jgi:photosystem II stability/assembly factor-like uncharacterized protein
MTKPRLPLLELSPALSLLLAALLLLGLGFSTVRAQQEQVEGQQARAGTAAPAKSPFGPLAYRQIGPFRGGRSAAVTGVASQPMVYYFGATGGGVWKTTDGGVTWEPLGDQTFKTGSVGAIGVAESDPNVVYIGMGEETLRGNVSHGDGMYKSMDAGKTWKKLAGLDDTRQIARVRVHPRNPDLVYVAAIGHSFGPNEQRGVFRSKDGGKTWEKILYRGPKAGAIDLTFDPTNANILYAALWEIVRKPWTFESGGPTSGLFKSTDGGDTWTELTRAPGMPRGTVGKIGVTVSPANPERVWAIVEAEDGGVFRSDNGGRTWAKVNESRNLRQRAWYYTKIYADPQNAEGVYVLNTGFYRSNDGGRTFSNIGVPHGDNHDLWLAPNDAQRMIEANDGGANVSFNGGRTWTEQDQPTAQFYRVALDEDFPYHIYGAQQDNSTVAISSRTEDFGIGADAWHDVGGGESGWIAPSPKDSNIVFAGSYGGYLTRYDHRTKQLRAVNVWPENPMGWGAEGMKYRFQWNYPILFSPNDTSNMGTLYTAGDHLFRSTNEGQSWEVISPDLTRNDKSKQGPAGGPITKDNTSVEYYDTIFTVAESPVTKGVIWTGSDDGLVQVTRDDGKSWSNVTPRGMPEWIQINSIEASPHDAGTAYFAATMYKSDDYRPYLYKTSDYGKTWKKIDAGIPDGAFTRVVREDPARRGLLYAGTELGMYISFDDGEHWQPFQLNLPYTPITDLAIHKRENDLVVATQGRAFWILDDLSVLHQMTDAMRAGAGETTLLKPEDTYRMAGGGGGAPLPPTATVGANPPSGAVVYYYLKSKPTTDVTLEFIDPAGKSVRKFTARAPRPAPSPAGGTAGQQGTSTAPGSAQVQQPPEQPAAPSGEESSQFGGQREPRVTTEQGLNRFIWDMRYLEAARFPGMILWAGDVRGPRAVPGTYQVKLTADGKSYTQVFEIKKDPRLQTTAEDFQKQLALLSKIRDKLTETHNAVAQIRDVKRQLGDLLKRAADAPNAKPVLDAGRDLNAKLSSIEEELYQTKNQSSQDPLNFPIKLNNKLAALGSIVGSADAAPTDQSYTLYDELAGKIDVQLQRLTQVMTTDLKAFNNLVRTSDIPAVIVKPSPGAATTGGPPGGEEEEDGRQP